MIRWSSGRASGPVPVVAARCDGNISTELPVRQEVTISRGVQPSTRAKQAPVVQRVRIRYAKRGPLRFTSHRDVARAFERALRRARVPIAFSQGFTPHPKISYASAAPTGVASEAEYLEIALMARMDPEQIRLALDRALPPGLDVLAAVQGVGNAGLGDLIEAARWSIELPAADPEAVRAAVASFLAEPEVLVERLMKHGWRRFDARGAVLALDVADRPGRLASAGAPECAILDLVVRQVTPSVRPDDVLAGLRVVADLVPPVPPRVVRLAQGRLTEQGEIVDPLVADNDGTLTGHPPGEGGNTRQEGFGAVPQLGA